MNGGPFTVNAIRLFDGHGLPHRVRRLLLPAEQNLLQPTG